MKKLLEKDYREIVNVTFSIPDEDIFPYYQQVFNDHQADNPEMLQRLKKVLEAWIKWYKTEAWRCGPVWYEDDKGNKVYINEKAEVPLSLELKGVRQGVKREFFEVQIKVIENIALSNILKSSTKQKHEQRHSINFHPDIIDTIINECVTFISGQENLLKDLLTKLPIHEKIQFKGPVIKLVQPFRQHYEMNQITGKKEHLSRWICDHFTAYNYRLGKYQDLNPGTVKQYLEKEVHKKF